MHVSLGPTSCSSSRRLTSSSAEIPEVWATSFLFLYWQRLRFPGPGLPGGPRGPGTAGPDALCPGGPLGPSGPGGPGGPWVAFKPIGPMFP